MKGQKIGARLWMDNLLLTLKWRQMRPQDNWTSGLVNGLPLTGLDADIKKFSVSCCCRTSFAVEGRGQPHKLHEIRGQNIGGLTHLLVHPRTWPSGGKCERGSHPLAVGGPGENLLNFLMQNPAL